MSQKLKYGRLVEVYSALESTTKRLEKTQILADFFSEVSSDLLNIVTIMSLGRVFPVWSPEELGVGTQLLAKAISTVVGVTTDEVENQLRDQGDIGAASEVLFKNRTQTTFFTQPLTVEKVYNNLRKIPQISGNRAQSRKLSIIEELLSSASPQEAKYISRTVLEELRVGVGEGTIRDAISLAFNVDKEVLDRAHMLTNDLGLVAEVAKIDGREGLTRLSLVPGKPVKPMLAQLAPGIQESISEMGYAICETKYDGIRVQIHRTDDEILVFTRRLENISNAVPDIISYIDNALPHENFVIEGEIIVFRDGKPISFQHILQRIRRKYDIEKAIEEVPLTVYLFDVLYYGGPLIDSPLEKRREVLESIVNITDDVHLSRCVVGDLNNIDEVEFLFNDSIRLGHEGIMIKDPREPYIPGLRGKKMQKFKAEPESLDLVVVGGNYGKGKRANWIGSYLLAVRDESTDELLTIAHVGTGLDDETLELLTNRVNPIMLERKGKKVKIKPEIILEIGYSEIVLSPEYESGFSLRFPVVKRIRDDLSLNDIDTLDRVKSMFK